MNILNKLCLLTLLCGFIASCDFDKDNTAPPATLVDFKPGVSIHPLWSVNIGAGGSSQLVPALKHGVLFAVNQAGVVTAVDHRTGQKQWQTNTRLSITAGVAANDHQVIIAADSGIVIALNSANGHVLWKSSVGGDILATPAANNETVVIKTTDGTLSALSTDNGHLLWHHSETEPSLILHASSAPQIADEFVIAGFANGKLLRIDLSNGHIDWSRNIATPKGMQSLQRMVDIDADPVVTDGHTYVATYQGKIAALRTQTGDIEWIRDFSSHSGIAVDSTQVYGTDTEGHVLAFNRITGELNWRQTALADRGLSGPALSNNILSVGDGQGYMHILNKQDGRIIGRIQIDSAPILTSPVIDGSVFYVLTESGQLASFTVN